MTYIKDIGWFVLIVLLMPLWMALAGAGLVVILARHLYWWARGNTTAVSRLSGHRRVSGAGRRASRAGGRRPSLAGGTVRDREPAAPVVVAADEAAPVHNG